ncbi:aldehyde dehydrogenase (NAD+) [Dyadobacter jejuensis]|uniref:aldehyde dehydrogenase (NAD(+)) n=1 Tax=Dyadobacter jejuensis TaxID=1082580 RepID=A0A316AKT4_9BACT|nr:aldehyde dehydrogenase family protein [Dyadobacter jejuensis]PWJ58236.1 aldehyde dehydrogenase (NAD+) [Dyadobacter jejuensis]
MKNIQDVLNGLGIEANNPGVSTGNIFWEGGAGSIDSVSPVNGAIIARVSMASSTDYSKVVEASKKAFADWKALPAPKRGAIVREIGEALRVHKVDLGTLVSYEMGKSAQEGLGEVQEMIDICDFAVGLSRQLYGLTMHSERTNHRMYEQWHPLGTVGIISAFNFPVAVWSWNAMIALVCGNVCIWKPSEKTPLTAIACQRIVQRVLQSNGIGEGVVSLVCGDRSIGELMAADNQIDLLSATGSTRMGKAVAERVGSRLGKCLLELGGNNAIIVTPGADFNVAIPAIVFGAVGTAGQRCTSTRRVIVHESIYELLKTKLQQVYGQLKVGDPLDEAMHMGPLIDRQAVEQYERTVQVIKEAGGVFLVEPGLLQGKGYESGCYVKPCVAEMSEQLDIVRQETFAPILYLLQYTDLEQAIALQNDVPQGLSSAIFTLNIREAELFLSSAGSDCGIANVNIGTSGAEIGGAFGGEKETGGGRESGSDAWKAYMRRQTNTINYGSDLPLAQGIKFDLE